MITESTFQTLCRLLRAWVNKTAAGETPPDFGALFQTADRHLLSAAACAALESAGLMAACPPETAERFRQAKLSAIRRTLLVDAEREKVLGYLEESGIWHMPFKGVALNVLYPQYGTRQFADSDILFDAARWRDVLDHMRREGYRASNLGHGSHDNYQKPPVYNFEMHRKLFAENGNSEFLGGYAAYFADVKKRLVKNENDRFGYHFRDEDFYIYLIAHTFKHCGEGGTGLRTLLDMYLYRRARPEMDMAYVDGELEKLDLTVFEAVCRSLTDKLFGPVSGQPMTAEEQQMLDWVESSGVYGNIDNHVRIGLHKLQGGDGPVTARTRAKYLFRRVFPGWNWWRANMPFAYRHRWAVPFFWVYRLGRGVANGRKNLSEASAVYKHSEQ